MPTVSIKNIKEITLVLTENEANWLQGYLQNSFGEEDDETMMNRYNLFSALQQANIYQFMEQR